MKKKLATILCLIALCDLALAQKIVKIGKLKAVHSPQTTQARTPAPEAPQALKKIFGNLGSKTSAYNPSTGWLVAGPLSVNGSDQFFGLPFTPKVNAHVFQIRAAVLYNGRGDNQVNLSLYTDGGGVPGTLIGGPVTVTNLPFAPTCCQLAIGNLATSVAVTAGTQYWIVADTPLSGPGSDFFGTWAWVSSSHLQAVIQNDSTWSSLTTEDQNAAGAVYGTIP